jgi:hypothetical protein
MEKEKGPLSQPSHFDLVDACRQRLGGGTAAEFPFEEDGGGGGRDGAASCTRGCGGGE